MAAGSTATGQRTHRSIGLSSHVTLSTNFPLTYGLARLQARVGDLTTEAEWAALHNIEGLGPFLDAIRQGPLASWVASLSTSSDSHEIERHFRRGFGAHIEELTHWLPGRWHPGLRWLGLLPYLEVFAYLKRGFAVSRWMREDMFLFPYLPPAPTKSPPARQRTGFDALPDTWIEGWYQKLPKGIRQEHRTKKKFGFALLNAAGVSHDEESSDGWLLRNKRIALLRRLFYSYYTTPLAAFAYLGLILMETALLRAELQKRLLFPVQRESP